MSFPVGLVRLRFVSLTVGLGHSEHLQLCLRGIVGWPIVNCVCSWIDLLVLGADLIPWVIFLSGGIVFGN